MSCQTENICQWFFSPPIIIGFIFRTPAAGTAAWVDLINPISIGPPISTLVHHWNQTNIRYFENGNLVSKERLMRLMTHWQTDPFEKISPEREFWKSERWFDSENLQVPDRADTQASRALIPLAISSESLLLLSVIITAGHRHGGWAKGRW